MNRPSSASNSNSSSSSTTTKSNNSRSRNNNNSGSQNRSNNNQSKAPGKNRNRKRSRSKARPRNNRKGPKLTGFEKVERGYLNLLEKHLAARKKYYDLFHRADPKQLAKLERIFYKTLDDLREYEDAIEEQYKEQFESKYNANNPDNTYTTNHEISPEPEAVSHEGDFEDPHYLPTQAESSYAEDDEESSGSMEDYLKYKDL